jgi:hypothetical protein
MTELFPLLTSASSPVSDLYMLPVSVSLACLKRLNFDPSTNFIVQRIFSCVGRYFVLYCRLNIYCPQCDRKIINSNERLLLQAVCTNCPEDVIEYDWTSHSRSVVFSGYSSFLHKTRGSGEPVSLT